MLRFSLTSTTALAMALNIGLPLPATAQQAENLPPCSQQMVFPCAIPGSQQVIRSMEEFQAMSQGGATGGSTESKSQAQIDAEAAAQAQAEAERQAAEDAAQAQAEAAAQAQAEAERQAAEDAAQAQAEADRQAAEDAAQAEADRQAAEAAAQAQAEADRQAAEDAAQQAAEGAQKARDAATDVLGTVSGQSESRENQVPTVDPQAQAEAAARAEEAAAAAAAAQEAAEAVETTTTTVTEQEARSSDEEFATTAGGQPAAAPQGDDDDNEALKILGTAAAAGLGAYAIGKLLDGGGKVVSNTGDRVVIEQDGQYRLLKDDDTLLRRPGAQVETQTFSDGSTRTTVTAEDGTRTVTIRAADGRVLSRTRILNDGRRVVLFDDTEEIERVDTATLGTRQVQDYDYSGSDVEGLRAALAAASGELPDRRFSLNQIRQIDAVRHLVPVIALDAINFETGSAVIRPAEAEALSELGNAMLDAIDRDPRQVFLIEGHTDTVGGASYNLALSDRRAESVALALTEYFDVPPANMIVQGYGESDLKIRRAGDIRANRRAAVRNITPLLQGTDR